MGRRLTIGEREGRGRHRQPRAAGRAAAAVHGQGSPCCSTISTAPASGSTTPMSSGSVDIEATPRPTPEGGQPSTSPTSPSPSSRCRNTGCDTASSSTIRRRRRSAPNGAPSIPGVVADLTRRGLFGRGITAGAGVRFNSSNRLARAVRARAATSLACRSRRLSISAISGSALSLFAGARGPPARDYVRAALAQTAKVQFAYGYDFEKIRDQRATGFSGD